MFPADALSRLAALEAAVARLEALLGGSTRLIEEVRFPQGAAVAPGQALRLSPGAAPEAEEGAAYYDSTLRALRVRGQADWETVHSGPGRYGLDSAAVANLAGTTAEADVKRVTLAMPGPGLVLAWFHCNPYGAAGKYTRFRLKVGGAVRRSNTYWQEDTGGRGQVGFVWAEAAPAGELIVAVSAQNSDSGYATVFNDCTLMALGLAS